MRAMAAVTEVFPRETLVKAGAAVLGGILVMAAQAQIIQVAETLAVPVELAAAAAAAALLMTVPARLLVLAAEA